MSNYYGLALFSPPRSIGGIVANVTLSEEGADTYTITEHPVEVSSGGVNGAIADHMYRNPAFLVIKAGWSNSRPEALISNTIGLFTGATFNSNYCAQIYQQLLALQSSRTPFEILTGKRVYENMVIRSLIQTTDEYSENALLVTMICQEILTVTTQSILVPDSSLSSQPFNTASPTPLGTVQLGDASRFQGIF